MNKKELGIGICLMLVGLTMFLGSYFLPSNTMDWRFFQVILAIGGFAGVFLIGLAFVVMSFAKNPTKR